MHKFLGLTKRLNVKKADIFSLITSVAIASVFFLGNYFLGKQFLDIMWIFVAVMLSVILLMLLILAGFAVLKSLFLVSAEISLLIFLSQSYCNVPNRSIDGDKALKSLLVVGLIYITLNFCRSLYEALRKNYKAVENERWSKDKVIAVALFLIFAGLFLWQVFLVISPIIMNLCVYK